jgi:fumarate reductase flavoprotein subunit
MSACLGSGIARNARSCSCASTRSLQAAIAYAARQKRTTEMTRSKNNGTDLSFSRRSLLKGAAAATVLSAMPWSVRRAFAEQAFDVVVIGGGTAGIPAAIFAADRGARVALIEKGPTVGGTLFVSGGMMAGANTVFQKAKGIEDSPDAHYEDVMRINGNTSDPALTRLWADNAGATINWLAENGFTIGEGQPVTGTMYDHYSIPRYQWGAANGGSILQVIQPLLEHRIQEGRITLLTEAGAVDLIKDDRGAVTGVVTEDGNGKRSDIRGRNVVIASGGCAANATMFENLHGVPLYRKAAWPFSQGDGLMLGLGAGGYLRGAETYLGYFGSIPMNDEIPSPPAANMALHPDLRAPWEVFVNARGERFVREDHPSLNSRDRAMDAQPGHRFWAIFDQQILNEAPLLIPDWSRNQFLDAFNNHPMFTRASSLGELGVITGIDPAGLERSIRAYNTALERKSPDSFDRSHRPLPVSRAPFYAIRSQTWTLKSYAGLAVNKDLQVITEEGNPIKNLYAAGEVLGAATSGRSHTSGASVTPALTFGRLLGRKIV